MNERQSTVAGQDPYVDNGDDGGKVNPKRKMIGPFNFDIDDDIDTEVLVNE